MAVRLVRTSLKSTFYEKVMLNTNINIVEFNSTTFSAFNFKARKQSCQSGPVLVLVLYMYPLDRDQISDLQIQFSALPGFVTQDNNVRVRILASVIICNRRAM